MKTTITRIPAMTWLLTIAMSLFAALIAQAAKPGGGSTAPTYKYINLGTLGLSGGYANAINNFGMVVGSVDDDNVASAFLVVPKDANLDGEPDVWFEDLNQDGVNDLQVRLGRPPGFEAATNVSVSARAINDYGQILIGAGRQVFVLTPRDVNGDGVLDFDDGDADGVNSLMVPLFFDGVLQRVESAISINNQGQIVGNGYVGSNGPPMGFVLTGQNTDGDSMADTWFEDNGAGGNGLVQLLGYARGQYGELTTVQADRINDRGEIAGSVPRGDGDWGNACLIRPRLTSAGQTWNVDANEDGLNDLVVKLLPVSTSAWGSANAINATGKLTGWGTLNRASSTFATLWQVSTSGAVTTTKLPKIGGEGWHYPRAINSQDVIVGHTVTYGSGISVRSECAFVYQNGSTKDLRTLTDQAEVLKGAWMSATDINEAGQIVGGTHYEFIGGDHPFIAVPIKK